MVPAQQGSRDREGRGASGKFFVTPHAVDRYRQLIPGKSRLTYNQALGELIRWAERAHFVKRSNKGAELWRTGKPLRMYLVVSSENPGKPQVVTVLPAFEGMRKR